MSGIFSSGDSADKIAEDLARIRTDLTQTVSDLEDYFKPKQVASRGVQKATDFFMNEDGQIKPERAAMVAVALLGLIGLFTRDRD